MLRIFVSDQHPYHYIMGGPAVVLAESPEQARELIVVELRKTLGMDDDFWKDVYISIQEIENCDTPQILSLFDGEY